MSQTSASLETDIWTVWKLLGRPVRVPDYQRPYKWSSNHVAQLMDDLRTFQQSGRYRVGTLILHDNDGHLDIVDGQQRFVTFVLLAHQLSSLVPRLADRVSAHGVSSNSLDVTRRNLLNNSRYISDTLAQWRESERVEFADYFLHNCEVVVLTLSRPDEAFQMFDSQNTRGRPLYPTDLLKAFHIREMSSEHVTQGMKLAMVKLWEDLPPEGVNELFSDYLFKIKRWANRQAVPDQGFTTGDIGMFKGIREFDATNAQNNWARPFLFAKNFTDDFRRENGTLIRYGALAPVDYPFQIDQPVINGETFFKMVAHYYGVGRRCGIFRLGVDERSRASRGWLEEVVEELDKFADDSRMLYIRNLFNCLILYYVDRFGEQQLDRATHLLLWYCLSMRIVAERVSRRSVNNYALGRPPKQELPATMLFDELRQALRADDFLRQPVPLPDTPPVGGSAHYWWTKLKSLAVPKGKGEAGVGQAPA